MLPLLRQSFHLSQATVGQKTEHIAHHRPLGLLLVLTLIAWQSGIFATFAAALPVPLATRQGYVYIQSSPIIDDAWIGTRVSVPITTPVTQLTKTPTITRTQIIDTSWLGNFTQSKKSPLLGEHILNAAPSIPTPDTTLTYPYPVQYTTPNGTPINNISSSYSAPAYVSLVNSVFGRNGAVTGQSGDYTTSLVTEGSNLYFTDTRAQDALSGSLSILSGDIITLSGQTATNTASIGTLSGNLATTNSVLATVIGNITILSGSLVSTNTDLLSLSGTVANKIGLTTLSALGPLTYNNATGVFGIDIADSTTTGALSSLDWNTFNSKESILTFGTGITRVGNTIGLTTGADGEILSMASGVPTWITPATFSVPVFSVFGRTGSILATLGDYTTSLVTEGSNLYFTQGRFDTALSLKTTTDLTEGTNLYFTDTRAQDALSGSIANIGNSINILSGSLATTNSNLLTLSGIVTNKIELAALSTTGPLTYNNTTGVFGIGQASTSMDGYLSSTDWNTFNTKQNTMVQATTTASGWLSSADWNTFNNKESVLTFGTGITRIGNSVGLTNTGITFAIGTTGTDMNWSTAFTALGGTATLNIPDASATARGLVSTGAQIFTGSKTFATAPTFSGFTLGSVLFASTGGLLSQNNTSFFWDNANTRLGIGIATPTATLHVKNNLLTTTNLLTLTATGLTTGNALQIIGSGSRNLLRVSQNTTDPLDIERVTIGQGGISATKPDGLARDQLYVFGRINSSWNSMTEDFMTRRANAVVTNDATFNNTLYFDDATGGSAVAGWQVDVVMSPGVSGIARLSTQTTGVNFSSRLMTSTNVTQRSLNPVFEARVLGTITANHRIQVGFANTVVGSTWTADATYGGQTDGIFFRKNAAGNVWQTVTRVGGVETTNNTTMSTNAYHTLRIEVNNVVGNAAFYIDGVLQSTHTTNLPAAATALGYGIGTAMSAATAGLTVDIDYIRVWSDDPPAVLDILEPGQEGYISDLFIPTLHDTEIEDTLDFITTQNIVTTLSRFLDATGTGVLDTNRTLSGDNTMDLTDTGNYLVRLIKQLIERLSEVWLEMRLYVRSLRTEEITTEKLCIGETCITEDELKTLLQSRGVQSSSSSVSSGNSVPATEVSTGSTDSSALVAPIDEAPVETLPVDTVSTGSTDTILPLDPTPPVETTPVVDASGTVSP